MHARNFRVGSEVYQFILFCAEKILFELPEKKEKEKRKKKKEKKEKRKKKEKKDNISFLRSWIYLQKV